MNDANRAVIDRTLLLELEQAVGRTAYLALFATLLGQLRQTAGKLEAALDRTDSAEIERYAHSLVSSAGHIGALGLAEAARALAKAARVLNLEGEAGQAKLETLAPSSRTVRDLLQGSLAQLTALERDPSLLRLPAQPC